MSRLSSDDLLAIPGNRPVFEALVSNLGQRDAIAFVGAGASAGLYPLWPQLIDRLIAYALSHDKATPSDAARWRADATSTPQQRVNVIVRKLEDVLYRRFLRETFGPAKASDGRRYTGTHAALLHLPFRGYVTTNYDPALEFARMDLRPGCLTTGTPTWQDSDEVHRWYTGDVFARDEDCPILWLHGSWQRPEGIVLNGAEYFAAYRPGLYRDLFKALWGQRHLAFVGFGFNDPQFTFMVGEHLHDLKRANAEPRHVAILGLPASEDGTLPEDEAIREWHANLESDYHVRPLFYPVFDNDHSALHLLLDHVASACGCVTPTATPKTAPPAASSPSTIAPFSAKWFHEPTNDDKFTGRDEEIERLDRWVRDDAVRAIGVRAVGGTGKTALIGRWLKETDGWRSRPFAGLFAWSFYQSTDTEHFLGEFLRWTSATFGTREPDEKTDLARATMDVLRSRPIVLVLDGLEVLQEGLEDVRHGTFLDGDLRRLLEAFCRRDHASLAVLTSRFPFADLDPFLGNAFHALELPGLPPDQGARLLDDLDVGSSRLEREDVSHRLDGHPLGLRVFAEVLPDDDRDTPGRFLDHAFRPGQVPEGAPLNDRLRRLLGFYEKKLPTLQVRLLGIIALFRRPVADATVLRLIRGVFGQKKREPLPNDAAILSELRKLHVRRILTREPIPEGEGSACHPILRDHFRSVFLSSGANAARRTANLLKGRPSKEKPKSVDEIEPILLAIELLLDAEEYGAADELYKDRLDNGEIFLSLPAPVEGLRCGFDFVRDETRRRRCEELLSTNRQGFYLNEVGLFAKNCGDYDRADHHYSESSHISRELGDNRNLSRILLNETELLFSMGRLAESTQCATEALHFASSAKATDLCSTSHAFRAWPNFLTGHVGDAVHDFVFALRLQIWCYPEYAILYGIDGTFWAEFLLRTGRTDQAAIDIQANLDFCKGHSWNSDVARCHRLLGWYAVIEGRIDEAKELLERAECVFDDSQMLFELARLHVIAGEAALADADAEGALGRAASALYLAASRGMRLVHTDALVLRGKARFLKGRPGGPARAIDDADEALRLARECGYPWGERDSLRLRAAARTAKANHDLANNPLTASRERQEAERDRADAERIAARLVLTDKHFADAEAKAAKWIKEWEKQREKERRTMEESAPELDE